MSLAQNAYIEASSIYESSLDSNYKKNNGVFYTDISLAKKMIQDLRIPSDATIFDPCCGVGMFLYAAKELGYRKLYGADKDEQAIEFCKENTQGGVFCSTDTLGADSAEILNLVGLLKKPQYIIGNPPYAPIAGNTSLDGEYLFCRKVSNTGNNLFIAALIRALDLVAEDGYISYIIPKNFLHVASYSNLRKEILKEKTIVSIIDLGAYFKNVRGEQIVLTIKNSPCDKNNRIKLKKYVGNKFVKLTAIPQSFYNDEILIFNCKEDYSTYKKLNNSYQHLSDMKSGYVGRGKSALSSAISGKDIRKFGYKNMPIPTSGNKIFIQNIYSAESGIIASFAGNLEASQTVTVFTDGDEKMCRYILGILHSRLINMFLYKYCYNNSKLTMHTDAKYLKKIPLPSDKFQKKYFKTVLSIVSDLESLDYMSHDWFEKLEDLNQIVYKSYEIDEAEANYINSEMKRIQSKRWYSDE